MQKFKAGGLTFEKVTEIEARLTAEAYNGDMESAEFLASAYAMGNQKGIQKNLEKSREFLRLLIKNMNDTQVVAKFHMNLGLTYLEENEDEKAKEAFEEAAKLGSTMGMSQFTYTVLREVVRKSMFKNVEDRTYHLDDICKMTRFLRKANKKDAQEIMQSLTKRGIPFERTIEILERIATGEHDQEKFVIALDLRHAIWRLVNSFAANNSELKKSTEAKRHESAQALFALAKSGNRFRQCDLAWCLENGVGYQKNMELAKKWYQKAAGQGLPEAQERMRAFEENEVESATNSIKEMNRNK
jgi:TPR repeat protein